MTARARGWVSRVFLVLAAVACLAPSVDAQQAILTFEVDLPGDAPLVLEVAGTAVVRIAFDNASIREADDIVVVWAGGEDIDSGEEMEPIEVLAAFERVAVDLPLFASPDAAVGPREGRLEIIYTYCIDDQCFQIVDYAAFPMLVEAAAVAPPIEDAVTLDVVQTEPTVVVHAVHGGSGGFSWAWIAFVAAVGVVAIGLGIRRLWKVGWPAYAVLLVVIVGGLAYGVIDRQHEQAQGIGAVLCTSCVGIEEARTGDPRLTAADLETIAGIEDDIELVVFYAEWCHACPFAEALVAEVATHNERIRYAFSDVDREPELAAEHGVVRSGRTVVPAILRVDTGEVLFGVEDLERRLLGMLTGEAE